MPAAILKHACTGQVQVRNYNTRDTSMQLADKEAIRIALRKVAMQLPAVDMRKTVLQLLGTCCCSGH